MNSAENTTVEVGEFNLLELFEGFLSFWLILSEKIEKHYNEGINLTNFKGDQVNNIPRYIQRQLLAYAERQKKQVIQIALPQQQVLYRKYLYAMAAFIDEQLLQRVEWSEQKEWLSLMLELNLFGSRNSGEKLIEHIKNLSNKSSEFSVDEKALANCYLRVLWLGFDGKYSKDIEKLEQLRSQLISNADLTIPDLSVKTLFTQAYLYNASNDEQSRLAPISRWQRIIVLGVGFYLLISGFLWFVLTYQLEKSLLS